LKLKEIERFLIFDFGFRISDLYYIQILISYKSKTKNQKSKIKDQKSKIKDQKSKIKDQKSQFRNSNSQICRICPLKKYNKIFILSAIKKFLNKLYLNKENLLLKEFDDFVNIVKRLRKDCPWDRIQTHLSLRRCLLEETYEVLEAIDENNMPELKKELGDILLQVIFHSIIAEENKDFDLSQVITSVQTKLIERHPHVFGDVEITDSEEVKKNWELLKKKEGRKSVIEGIPEQLPALLKAYRIQEKASKVGFDWKEEEPVFDKITEELQELRENVSNRKPLNDIEDELGDVLFSIVNYSRFLKINPEDALRKTINKFRDRFSKIEKFAEENKTPIEDMTLEEMDVIWEKAKSENRKISENNKI